MSPIDVASRAHLSDLTELRLAAGIASALPRAGAVSTSAFDRVIAAVDASHYLLTPRAVVTPRDAAEVAALFAYATTAGETVTFRSGGTSLSGQASTGNILVDTRRHFRSITVLDDGARVRVGPGATVRHVNARLARHGRKLGPDPASEIACTIGGVVANNSSGMACGITDNSYRTLASARIVLPSGTVIDTGSASADEELLDAEPGLAATLTALRRRVTEDPALAAEIVRQYGIKNTMGYGLNSLLDHETPAQILAHLMIGSEGTLGFVAEATFNTVPLLPHAATALLIFESLQAATDALELLIETSPATIELMDAASLRAARIDPESRAALPALEVLDHCVLLVEYQAPTVHELNAQCAIAERAFRRLPLAGPAELTRDSQTRNALWHLRKGLYATIAGARPSGTTALLEDIAVPVAALSRTCAGLTALFRIHGYADAVIFGHAKDGNIHFLINEDFALEQNVSRYRAFTEDMVDLVLAAGGSLKAEHGTGRIMAPFVARQYGPELYGMMLQIKAAFDPAGILNPDTILTTDSDLHLKNLKSTPTVESEVDRCVECGYCEPVCPSKDLTTTPRQRIVVRRAIADATLRGDTALVASLEKDQAFEVVDSCAVDGMCQTACPVLINTGDLVRRLRSETIGAAESGAWTAAASAWGPVTRAASMALTVAASVPSVLVTGPNRAARRLLGADTLPLWSPDLPRGGTTRSGRGVTRAAVTTHSTDMPPDATEHSEAAAPIVYFAACVGTMFGPAEASKGVSVSFESLCAKAGIGIVRPQGVAGLCCGTPWKSKGIARGYHEMIERTVLGLWMASDEGQLTVVCDNSSCSEGLMLALATAVETQPRYAGLHIIDAIDFAAETLLPQLELTPTLGRVVVHPTCSSTRAGSNAHLMTLAAAVAGDAIVPDDWGCCAFAGDRGMLHPELTASATAREASEVNDTHFDAYVSCNRTCEIGMTRATGHPYQHVLERLDEIAAPRQPLRD